MSAGLSRRQEASLSRIGDIMAPKGEGFPAFSETGCVAHVDRVLAATPPDDVTGLKILLAVLSFFPRGLLLWFLHLVERDDRAPGFLAPVFRNIHLGLKGLVMSLYYSNRTGAGYSGPKPYDAIGCELRVVRP